MLKLIQNEWIKIFSKISTYVLLALTLAMTIGFSLLAHFVGAYEAHSYSYDKYDLNNEIAYLESSKPEGYEVDVMMYQFMLDNGDSWDMGSWEVQALYDIFSTLQNPLVYQADSLSSQEKTSLEERFSSLTTAVANHDFNSFATLWLEQIAQGTDSQRVKEAKSFPYQFMLDNNLDPNSDSWKINAAEELGNAMLTAASLEDQRDQGIYIPETSLQEAQDQLALAQYRLEHEIVNYMDEHGSTGSLYWSIFLDGGSLLTFLSVVMIVIAGGSVANEFSTGTIKFLLINPVKRSKIIISKFLALLLLGAALIVGMFAVNGLFNMILFQDGLGVPLLTVSQGQVHEGSVLLYTLMQYGLNGITMIAMTALAFMISSLMRSSAVAIGIGVASLLGGTMISSILVQYGFDWGRYLIFSNLNLSQIAEGYGMYPNQTLGFSVGVLTVYMILFLFIAYDGFTRREV